MYVCSRLNRHKATALQSREAWAEAKQKLWTIGYLLQTRESHPPHLTVRCLFFPPWDWTCARGASGGGWCLFVFARGEE